MSLDKKYITFAPFFLLLVLITLLNQRQELANIFSSLFVFFSLCFIFMSYDELKRVKPLVFLYLIFSLVIFLSTVNIFFRDDFKNNIVFISSLYPYLLIVLSYIFYSKYQIKLERLLPVIFLVFVIASYMTYSNHLSFSAIIERQARTNWANLVGACIPLFFLVKNKYLQLVLLISAFFVLSLGLKRTGIIVGLSSLTIYFVFYNASKNTLKAFFIKNARYAAFFIGAFAFSSMEIFDKGLSRLSRLAEDSGAGRVDLITQAISSFSEQPFIYKVFGGGYQYFHVINGRSFSSHNDLIDFLTSYGVVGFVIFLLINVRVITLAFNLWDTEYRQFSLCTLITFIIYSNSSSAHHYYYFFSFLFLSISYMEYLNNYKSNFEFEKTSYEK